VDTGRLRSSIGTTVEATAVGPVAVVGTDVEYAIFVHEGVGIYGPRGAVITPTRGRFLVFTPRGAPGPVFARSVRGSPGVPFLRDALRAARG
jgi:phage gpG-like protein